MTTKQPNIHVTHSSGLAARVRGALAHLRLLELHCPCGYRPEMQPHAPECPVAEAIRLLDAEHATETPKPEPLSVKVERDGGQLKAIRMYVGEKCLYHLWREDPNCIWMRIRDHDEQAVWVSLTAREGETIRDQLIRTRDGADEEWPHLDEGVSNS